MSADVAVALCAERVAAADPDRFAATMASPPEARPGLFALYAANLEIARAPWASAQPQLAEIRLMWWVEALEALAGRGTPPAHEIGPALCALPRPALAGLVAAARARQADCWAEPFANEAALWEYLAATSGQLYAAAGAVLGATSAALAEFGQAAGLAAWLRAQPELLARGRLTLAGGATPGEARHGAGAEARFAALAHDGLDRLARARAALREAPRAARFASLPGWQAAAVLRRAALAPEMVAQGRLGGSEFARRLGLLRARLTL